MDVTYTTYLITTMLVKELGLLPENITLNPVTEDGVENEEDIANWKGLMFLYTPYLDRDNESFLQVFASEPGFEPVPSLMEKIGEGEYKSTPEEAESHFEGKVEYRVDDLTRLFIKHLTDLKFETHLLPHNLLANEVEEEHEDDDSKPEYRNFPAICMYHPESETTVTLKCGPVPL